MIDKEPLLARIAPQEAKLGDLVTPFENTAKNSKECSTTPPLARKVIRLNFYKNQFSKLTSRQKFQWTAILGAFALGLLWMIWPTSKPQAQRTQAIEEKAYIAKDRVTKGEPVGGKAEAVKEKDETAEGNPWHPPQPGQRVIKKLLITPSVDVVGKQGYSNLPAVKTLNLLHNGNDKFIVICQAQHQNQWAWYIQGVEYDLKLHYSHMQSKQNYIVTFEGTFNGIDSVNKIMGRPTVVYTDCIMLGYEIVGE